MKCTSYKAEKGSVPNGTETTRQPVHEEALRVGVRL